MIQQVIQRYHSSFDDRLTQLTGQEQGDARAVLRVELLSKRRLVVWIALCLIHRVTRHAHPAVMQGYGIALDWKDMRDLVLSQREAQAAALEVCTYAKANAANPLFCFHEPHTTFHFAHSFTSSSAELMSRLQAERTAAATKEADHWQKVEAKKRSAAQLRSQISDVHHKLSDVGPCERYYRRPCHCSPCTTRDILETQLSSLESQLKSTLNPPDPVFQALPDQLHGAKVIVFFMHMPQLFRTFSEFTMMAQQMMVPHKKEVYEVTALTQQQFAEVQKAQVCSLRNWSLYPCLLMADASSTVFVLLQ